MTWGLCSPEALELLETLGGAWAEKTCASARKLKMKHKQWRADLGCALFRAMACTVRNAYAGPCCVVAHATPDDVHVRDEALPV